MTAAYLGNRTLANTTAEKKIYELFFAKQSSYRRGPIKYPDESEILTLHNNTQDTPARTAGIEKFLSIVKTKQFTRVIAPETYEEAVRSPDSVRWIQAMEKEMKCLEENNTEISSPIRKYKNCAC
ncbi:hypothetical protein ILUMI_05956 [Ignelater luminosus]|uniref:Uncharacterized protein n=1 Tax=Ignelater luminosus TaxID=2038154 RepID=A0A8K0DBM7_IGNLU|nr:hypothetical protein ILUMI_05956 [Ignelater luminosus]